ncbi:MAG: GNAT family N-acetyltransferase [Clostridia bacterium]|nr:GNAT family N-acetyltransferase [Clostridia bacterium]
MDIREYAQFREDEILRLYSAVGWTAYTENMQALRKGYGRSLLVLAAYENEELAGIIRAVGDGFTIVFIQDILVYPEKQRRGVGTALLRAVLDRFPQVRQIQLTTDDTPRTNAFYRSLGFVSLPEKGCCGYMKA